MAVTTTFLDEPAAVLDAAGVFLNCDPVRHNLILTLLSQRVEHPEPGRYWLASADGSTCGLVMQSPVDFHATMVPMLPEVVDALVDAVVDSGASPPGITGEAATASQFAGQWTERTRAAAVPDQGQRLYELDQLIEPRPTSGAIRLADPSDKDVLVSWSMAFAAELGEKPRDPDEVIDRRLAAEQLYVWDDGAAVAFAGRSAAVAGVVRIGPVFTPPDRRSNGYASSLTAAIAREATAQGLRSILYTDLANPTSNAIYRAIGFRSCMEALRYSFA